MNSQADSGVISNIGSMGNGNPIKHFLTNLTMQTIPETKLLGNYAMKEKI